MTGTPVAWPRYADWEAVLADGSYEDVFAALEAVVTQLEDAQLPLADALACYELGVRLAARCDEYLRAAELRVTELDEVTETVLDHVTLGSGSPGDGHR